ncbi:MAG: signal peptide peptidase SppA [Pirellulales bacterium]|nr:signal peptide peptidase SppA [Pirellulales bacterium]
MVIRRQNVTTWLVVVLLGFFVLVPATGVLAGSEPEQTAVAEKAVEKPAKKKTAKKSAAKDKKTKKEKTSFLSKLITNATSEKGGKKTVKVEVTVNTEQTAKKKEATKKAKTKKAVPVVVRLKLTGSYPEAPESPSPFGASKRSLTSLLKKFKELAEDKQVAAVLLEIEASGLGSGTIHEIRQAITRFRADGKPIYALLTSADGSTYLVAGACDEILMAPSGMLMIPGVRAEVTFYKGLLDKLGIQFEVLQMGKYKGAGEPFSRAKMSKPLRESFRALVDDRYEWLVQSVAQDRKLKDYQVKSLIDRGFFTAAAAKKAGLVDQIIYTDAFVKQLPKKLKVDEIKIASAYKSKRDEIDLSGIGGMMKLMQMMMGGKPGTAKTSGKKIALVYAVGAIVEGKSSQSLFGGSVLGSTTLVEALKKAADDPDVVAVVLRVDSPGGSAIASDLIWRETVRMKKPLIASMGNVAGSGGYYISMGADKIFAEPGTITGSIGVIGGKPVMAGLYKKLGLTTEVISRGANSGALSATQPFTPSEREAWMEMLRTIYKQFVSKAAKGRNMSYAELHELAQGRIYSGEDAVENGLVDQLGTLDDALAEAKKAAGLKKGEKVQVLILPKPKTFFEQLFEDPSASTDAVMQAAGPLADSLRETAVLRQLFTEPVLLWMPYKVELR